tara:strand:- start:1568 stop:2263 length:696 start_codon:yes stop_codon:yes gene_type:complete
MAGSSEIDLALTAAAEFLRQKADPEKAFERKRYLKSPYDMLGCTVPTIRTAAKKVKRACPEPPLDELIQALNDYYSKNCHEDRLLANFAATHYVEMFDDSHVSGMFKDWLLDSHNWDFVDGICTWVVGRIALTYPDAYQEIESWTVHEWMWLRRASVLCHLPAIGAGTLRVDQLKRSIDLLIEEKEFFIRKVIGWVLRELSKHDPILAELIIDEFRDRASGLTLREATKYL